jgi:agmatine deiminase
MPAEWEPHELCLVSWPCREATWKSHFLRAKESYRDVIKAISQFEPVVVLSDPSTAEEARSMLGDDVEVLTVELDDAWARDNGPIFVKSGDTVAMVGFRFNGWGNKAPFEKDGQLPRFLSRIYDVELYEAPMVLEGGAITVDGQGTLLTTEQCLLNRNRNPDMSRKDIEQVLSDYLGARKVVWLWRGVEGDFTDGHVDGVASFVSPHTVMAMSTSDSSDPNHELLEENISRLETSTDSKNRSLEVIRMVQPRPFEFCGKSITPCYANFYIANGGVVVPLYGVPEDQVALDTLRSVFSDREVVGVMAAYIELGGGAVHCITQQVPKGVKRPR